MIKKIFSSIAVAGVTLACSSAATAQTREIVAENTCPEALRLAIEHSPDSSGWQTKWWYYFEPGQRYYLSSSGQRLRHRVNAVLYAYAETPSGRGIFGDLNNRSDPRAYSLIELNDNLLALGREIARNVEDDHFLVKLTCNDTTGFGQ